MEGQALQAEQFETLPPIVYDTNLATIAKLREQFMPLEITDLEDKEQFKTVHDARMVMVKVRTTIEDERKEKKAKVLQYGRDVDAAAKELFDASAPVETHLKTEEDKVLNEQKRIEEEKKRLFQEKIQGRVDALLTVNAVAPFSDVASWTDEQYESAYSMAKELFEAEQEAKAEEEARLAEEREELARRAEEQAKRDKEQAEQEAKLRAEREAFEKEKREAQEAKNREAFEKQAKENARIQAEKDAAEKVEREKREAAEVERKAREKEEAGKAEAARQEALKPDKEKLTNYAIGLTAIIGPDVESEKAHRIVVEAEKVLSGLAETIINQAEEL